MKAIIFAAGIGSRLKPFTDFHPKALAPVNGRPAIGILMEKLVKAGVRSVVVNIHHFPEQIREYFKANNNFGINVEFSDESGLLLDTGGALAKIGRESRIFAIPDQEPILIHNADILTDFPIEEMEKAHVAYGADATILVDPGRESSRKFLFDSQMQLKGWRNFKSGEIRPADLNTEGLSEAAFGGVHMITPDFLKKISSDSPTPVRPFSIVDYYLGQVNALKIHGFTPENKYRWFDIGSTEKLVAAERGWNS